MLAIKLCWVSWAWFCVKNGTGKFIGPLFCSVCGNTLLPRVLFASVSIMANPQWAQYALKIEM